MINKIRTDTASEHYLSFGQYINSLKEVISKIPSRDRANTHIVFRVDQDEDWRSFKTDKGNQKKSKKIFFRDEESDDSYSDK